MDHRGRIHNSMPAPVECSGAQNKMSRPKHTIATHQQMPYAGVNLAGDENSGKSSLFSAILNGRPHRRNTKGNIAVESKDWYPDGYYTRNGEQLKIRLRDFAAHKLYLATQHSYHTPYSLCVLVIRVSLNSGDKEPKDLSPAQLWVMSMGEKLQEDIRVLMVASYWDYSEEKRSEFEAEMNKVYEDLQFRCGDQAEVAIKGNGRKSKAAGIKFEGCIGVDCNPASEDGYNIESVQKRIAELSQSLVDSVALPREFRDVIDVKEEFLQKGMPVVSVGDFFERLDKNYSCLWNRITRRKKIRIKSDARRHSIELASAIGELKFDESIMPGIIILDSILWIEMFECLLYEEKENSQEGWTHKFKYVQSNIHKHKVLHSDLNSKGTLNKRMFDYIWHFPNNSLGGFSESRFRKEFIAYLQASDVLLPLENEEGRGVAQRYIVPERLMRSKALQNPDGQIEGRNTPHPIGSTDFKYMLRIGRRVVLSSPVDKHLFCKCLCRILGLTKHGLSARSSLDEIFKVRDGQIQYRAPGCSHERDSMALSVRWSSLDTIEVILALNHPTMSSEMNPVVYESGELFSDIWSSLEEVLAQNGRYVTVEQLGIGGDCKPTVTPEDYLSEGMKWVDRDHLSQPERVGNKSQCTLTMAQHECFKPLLEIKPKLQAIGMSRHLNFVNSNVPCAKTRYHPDHVVFIPRELPDEKHKEIEDMVKAYCEEYAGRTHGPKTPRERSKRSRNRCRAGQGSSGAELYSIRFLDELPPEDRSRVQPYVIYRCHPVRNWYINVDEYESRVLKDSISLFQYIYAREVKISIGGSEESLRAFSLEASVSEIGGEGKLELTNSSKDKREYVQRFKYSPENMESEFPLNKLDKKTLLMDKGKMKNFVEARLIRGKDLSFDRVQTQRSWKSSTDINLALKAASIGKVGGGYKKMTKKKVSIKIEVYYYRYKGSSWEEPCIREDNSSSSNSSAKKSS